MREVLSGMINQCPGSDVRVFFCHYGAGTPEPSGIDQGILPEYSPDAFDA